MSAFAASSFSSALYHSARPTYPASLFKIIYDYHKAHSSSNSLAVDIACGTGGATAPLKQYFDKVIGIDNSPGMIQSANKAFPDLDFHVSKGETFMDAAKLAPGSIDLATVAQGIHWFDFPVFMSEAHRSLKQGGTLAFWGYCDPAITNYPRETDELLELSYGKDKLGPYWEQPGRGLLRQRIPFEVPKDLYKDVQRYENVVCSQSKPALDGGSDKFVMVKQTTFGALKDYGKTWSSWHNWKTANPEIRDIMDECFDKMMARNNWKDDTEIELKWDAFIVLATKK